jgi:RNA recognition motif-containing protein
LKLAFVAYCNIIKDKFTGESRGFGFIEMPNKDEPDKAIAGLKGKDMKGRNLTVNEARPTIRVYLVSTWEARCE